MKLHTQAQIDKADGIFKEFRKTLSPGDDGKMVAIDIDSGEVFLGETEIEAFQAASTAHPGKTFVFKRVGSDVTYFVGTF